MVGVWRPLLLCSSLVVLISILAPSRTLSAGAASKDQDDRELSQDFLHIKERDESFRISPTEHTTEPARRGIVLSDGRQIEARFADPGLSLMNLNPGSSVLSLGEHLAVLTKRQAEQQGATKKSKSGKMKKKKRKGKKSRKSKSGKKRKSKAGKKKKPKVRKPKGKKKKAKKGKGRKKSKHYRGKLAGAKVTKKKKGRGNIKVTVTNQVPADAKLLLKNNSEENTTRSSTANIPNKLNGIINAENNKWPSSTGNSGSLNSTVGQSGISLIGQTFNVPKPKLQSNYNFQTRQPTFSIKKVHSSNKILPWQSGKIRAKTVNTNLGNGNLQQAKMFKNQNNRFQSSANFNPGRLFTSEHNQHHGRENLNQGKTNLNNNNLYQSNNNVNRNLNHRKINVNLNNLYQSNNNFNRNLNQGKTNVNNNNLYQSNNNANRNLSHRKTNVNNNNLYQSNNNRNVNHRKINTNQNNNVQSGENLNHNKRNRHRNNLSPQTNHFNQFRKQTDKTNLNKLNKNDDSHRFKPKTSRLDTSHKNLENEKYSNLPLANSKFDGGQNQDGNKKMRWNKKKRRWQFINSYERQQKVLPRLEDRYSTSKSHDDIDDDDAQDRVVYPIKDKHHHIFHEDEDKISDWR